MSVCEHDIYCPGSGPQHDVATKRPAVVPTIARMTEEQRAQLLAELKELKENRLAARKDARSGNPAKSAQGKTAAKAITHMIAQRHLLIRQENEK